MKSITLALPLERRIWVIRGRRVMLDSDLAQIYGVPTKRLNEQVRRNINRFPNDFAFRLSGAEALNVLRSRSQFATLKRGQNIKYLPTVFTEHGAVMLASVLNSPTAISASLQVVRAFVRLRELIAERDGLGRKLNEIEQRLDQNSGDIERIFSILDELVVQPGPSDKRTIGFIRTSHEE